MNSQELVDRVDQLSLHCTSGDFTQVIERLSEALRLNPGNYTLYSNRAAAYMRVGKFKEALTDAKKVLELKPDWTKVGLLLKRSLTVSLRSHGRCYWPLNVVASCSAY